VADQDTLSAENPSRIYGRRPVLEALRSGLPLSRIYIQDSLADKMSLRELSFKAREAHVPLSQAPRRRLDELAATGNHQGVVALLAAVAARDEADLESLVAGVANARVLVLDGVQDPHNLGAIVRVADAAGVCAVVVPRHGSAPLSPAAMKASAGALAWHPVVQVTNLSRTLEYLKTLGFFIWAAVPEGRLLYDKVSWSGSVALVLGGEGRGIRPLVLRHADDTVRLPMEGRIQSLNVGTAAAVFLFEMLRQKRP
jgi:23S rRNA (guanosine2251-2'-O)-methyltransferase